MPEQFISNCVCPPPGLGVAPSLLPYVYSVNDLQGQITLAGTGAVSITSLGNTITIDVSAEAGLGSVTSVALASSSSNLVIVSGSPITTNGIITLNFAGNIGSIAGLTMVADQMLYSTAADTFAATSLPAFGRTLIANANAADARTDLGLVIGTDVQAFSSDLSAFVTNASWSGGDLTLTGGLTISGLSGLTVTNANINAIGLDVTDNITAGDSIVATNSVTAATFSGNGAALTALNGTQITTGTVDETVGGTGNTSYVAGDLLQGTAANVLSKLASVAAGSYLRSGGVTTASVWSTLVLPNAGTVGDIFHCTSSNTMGRLTAVATGNVLLSGGVATASSWGKVTTSHTTGIAASGSNADITALSQLGDVTSTVQFHQDIGLTGAFSDASTNVGNVGDIMTSTNTGTAWTNQIAVDTIRVDTTLSTEGTITAAGVTGNQVINKLSGTVRIAAAGTSVIVTNSLCTTSSYVLATCRSNDATAYVKSAVPTSGAFTITLGAAATAEVEIGWLMINFS